MLNAQEHCWTDPYWNFEYYLLQIQNNPTTKVCVQICYEYCNHKYETMLQTIYYMKIVVFFPHSMTLKSMYTSNLLIVLQAQQFTHMNNYTLGAYSAYFVIYKTRKVIWNNFYSYDFIIRIYFDLWVSKQDTILYF